MALIDVYHPAVMWRPWRRAKRGAALHLWRVLVDRDATINISHRQMPTFQQHAAFIRSDPYVAWYLIQDEGHPIGACYLTHADEIGIHILSKYRSTGRAAVALRLLMETHPRERYLANVNPGNTEIVNTLLEAGFALIQKTYELAS